MKPKNPEKLFPLFVTDKLSATKRFYVEQAEFSVAIDMPEYLQVRSPEPGGPELCFMKPDAFPDGRARPAFGGKGVLVSIPTKSADDKFARMKSLGAELLDTPSDKPWGWRSFQAVDPAGVILDFFHVEKEMPPAP